MKGNFFSSAIAVLNLLVLPATGQFVSLSPLGIFGVASGGDGTISCFSNQDIVDVDWLINETSLNLLNLTGVSQQHEVTIIFRNVSELLNNTIISCIANGVKSSVNATLLVQGLLYAVGSLTLSTTDKYFFLSWTAPFTIDITQKAIDIMYCVEVVGSLSSGMLHSECEIVQTEFRYSLPPRFQCFTFNFTVIPVNSVGNGTENSVYLPQQRGELSFLEVTANRTSFSLIFSNIVCPAVLILVDINTGYNLTLEDSRLIVMENIINLSADLLMTNRHYRMTVIELQVEIASEIISTHDVTNCTITPGTNEVIVSVSFVDSSQAAGALLAFIFKNESDEIDFYRSHIQVVNRSDASNDFALSLDLLSSGQYVTFVYDIESDQRIMEGSVYAATSCSFDAFQNTESPSSPRNEDCVVSSYGTAITVECSTLMSFQVLAQLNDEDSVSILHTSASKSSHSPVTLHVPENGEYLVTVLPTEAARGVLSGIAFFQTHVVSDAPITIATTTADLTLEPLDINTSTSHSRSFSTTAVLEFVCSQSPYSIKGLLLGLVYTIRYFFKTVAIWSILPFGLLDEKLKPLSCGSSYYLMNIIIGFLVMIIFIWVVKRYHYRTVNKPSNEYRYAEEYFSNIQ